MEGQAQGSPVDDFDVDVHDYDDFDVVDIDDYNNQMEVLAQGSPG